MCVYLPDFILRPLIDKTIYKVRARVGKSATLDCKLFEGDGEIMFVWLFSSNFYGRFHEIDTGISSYVIPSVTFDHAGFYRCVATSLLGEDSHTMELIVPVQHVLKQGHRS
ncbi:uncharacterized protein [Choristoneura fumiferana]|uniref:uncharacterized protein n=1 Tax=Choristoneura fumiferana TaxID=7141 RepID=UPI003D156A1A